MIITTFSPEGYRLYGKKFLETYKEHCSYPLILYVEDDLQVEGVECRNLYDIPGCEQFLTHVSKYRPATYRMDVNKFCRKVFAMTDAGLRHDGKFAFIGADTIFVNKVPDGFLDNILDNVYLAYLGRSKLHSETDFIAFDAGFSGHKLFMNMFKNMYFTGAFQDLRYWCDSDVFDHVRILLNYPENNLNKMDDHNHPFVNSILGNYMLHLKGPERKMMGQCFDSDFKMRPPHDEEVHK